MSRGAKRAQAKLVRAGFDEAGLGPTLGPLVVAGFATARRDDSASGSGSGLGADIRGGARGTGPVDDLRGPLAALVGEPGDRKGRLEVGDSKKIHTGTRKLARVERTALATVAWIHGRVPATVAELLELVCALDHEGPGDRRAPWWSAEALDEALPIAHESEAIAALGEQLRALGESAGVEALWYRADVISAARVNRELAAEDELVGGSKNTWATHAVLRHAAGLVAGLDGARPGTSPGTSPGSSAVIWCDKAGGRQAYVDPLRRAFPELAQAEEEQGAGSSGEGPLFSGKARTSASLTTVEEVRARSHYALTRPGMGAVDIGFVMGGDLIEPRISWASILAKYLRELILRAFNRHFQAKIPGLRATAGYPQDARRFITEVEAALGPEGGLERAAWVRSK